MNQEQNKKTLRHFQCRDYLWEIFEQMSAELECSTDYLINEAMRQYARSRNYGTRTPSAPGIARAPSSAGAPAAGAPLPPMGAGGGGGRGPGRPQIPSAPPPPPSRPMPPQYPQSGGAFAAPPPAGPPSYGGYAAQPGPPQSFGGMPQAPPVFGGGPGLQGPPGRNFTPAPGYPPPVQPAHAPPPSSYPPPPTARPPAFGAPPPLPGAPRVSGPVAVSGMPPLYVIFNGQKIPITKEEFVIGRGSKTADLPIKDGNISRRHAAVVFQTGSYFIKDLGSTNGIEFQGRRIESKRIEEGDIYQLCDYELRFTYR